MKVDPKSSGRTRLRKKPEHSVEICSAVRLRTCPDDRNSSRLHGRSCAPLFLWGQTAGCCLERRIRSFCWMGVPLEGSPAEKQVRTIALGSGTGQHTVFFASVTEEEVGRFARALFPTGKAKPAELALQLKAALAGAQGIRINEVLLRGHGLAAEGCEYGCTIGGWHRSARIRTSSPTC